jgi:hypothetical protein
MKDLEQHMHGRFADLAEEMPDTDLLDRVHRTSRRIRRRRRAMVVTAAAAILATAVTIPSVSRHSDPVLNPSVTTPAPTGPPSSTPSARPSSTGQANPPSTRAVKSWNAVYVTYDRGYRFVERASDGSVRTLTTIDCNFYSVSPDGRQVAWIGNRGDVIVRSFSGGSARTVWKNATPDNDSAILLGSWSADSTRLLINVSATAGDQVMSVASDGSGHKVVGETEGPLHMAWSADGNTIAGYTGETDGVVVLDSRTGRTHRVPGISMADRVLSNHVESLSPDGSKVVVHLIKPTDPGGDPGWPPSFKPTILDTRTGARVPIGVSGPLLGARYLPDGTLVVRKAGKANNTIIFLGPNGKVLKTQAEPAELHDAGLLSAITEN